MADWPFFKYALTSPETVTVNSTSSSSPSKQSKTLFCFLVRGSLACAAPAENTALITVNRFIHQNTLSSSRSSADRKVSLRNRGSSAVASTTGGIYFKVGQTEASIQLLSQVCFDTPYCRIIIVFGLSSFTQAKYQWQAP